MEEITIIMTKRELRKLDRLCKQTNKTRDQVIRGFIDRLHVRTKKEIEEDVRQWIIEKTEMDHYYSDRKKDKDTVK